MSDGDWSGYVRCILVHPEYGRVPTLAPAGQREIVLSRVWIPDERHPLGGRAGDVVLRRRVNLHKDPRARWSRARPLYEFAPSETVR